MAGVSDWHKQQRKKELKKNKETRLAARNERVLVEKSIPGLRMEIAILEASLKANNGHAAQHATQMKVDRLKKELKLLLQKEEEATSNKKSKPAVHSAAAPIQRPLPPPVQHAPLVDPRVSIYYDAIMNPFGEPPPNRPRLFHRRGGGATLTLREACVPGEQEQPDAAAITAGPAPVPMRSNDSGGRTNETTQRVEQVSAARTREDNGQPQPQRGKPPTTAKKAKLTTTSSSAVPPHDKVAAAETKATISCVMVTATTTEPKSVPALPVASASVQRSKKLTVDIWASNLELEYEYDSWEYRDQLNNAVQGPYSTQQMQNWIVAGHFPASTLVRPVHADEWKKLCQIKELWDSGHDDTKNKKKTKRQQTADDDPPPTDVQQRIASLRQQQQPPPPSHNETISVDVDVADSSSIQARIAALRAAAGDTAPSTCRHASLAMKDDVVQDRMMEAYRQEDTPIVAMYDDDDNNSNDDVQSRIARLRAAAAGGVAREPVEQVTAAATTTATTTIEWHNEPNLEGGVTLEHAPVQLHHHSVSTGSPLPPPPPPPPAPLRSSAGQSELPSYPTKMPLPPPPPPAPLAAGRNTDEDLPCYPIDIMESSTMDLPSYPLLPSSSVLMEEEDVNMVVAPYPMPTADEQDEGHEAHAIYPLTNIRTDVLAAEASSPSVSSRPPERRTVSRPGLPSATVDKSVVAFLPTALQRKRPR